MLTKQLIRETLELQGFRIESVEKKDSEQVARQFGCSWGTVAAAVAYVVAGLAHCDLSEIPISVSMRSHDKKVMFISPMCTT